MTDYFVDATLGNDGAAGTSELAPWKTLDKADDGPYNAGDIIRLKKDEEWRESFVHPSAGAGGSPIELTFWGSGADPILNGADLIAPWIIDAGNVWKATLTTNPNQVFFNGTRGTKEVDKASLNTANEWFWEANVLYVYSTSDPDIAYTTPGVEASVRTNICADNAKDYITFDGLTVRYSNSNGFIITGDNGAIENCTATYNETGNITLWGTSIAITSYLIHNCTCSYSNTSQGIFLGESVDGPTGVTIEYCIINNNGSAPGDNGIYLDYADSNIIRYNIIYSNYDHNVQLQHGSDSNQIYYNLIYSAGDNGMWVGTGAGGDSNLIYNNVFFENTSYGLRIGAGASNVIKNNILQQPSGGDGSKYPMRCDSDAIAQAQTWDYNSYYYPGAAVAGDIIQVASTEYNLAQWQAYAGSPGANSISGDPLFIDAANDDFTLQSTSPCINAGVDVGLDRDFAGTHVPQGVAPDIGAYEYETADELVFNQNFRSLKILGRHKIQSI